MYLQFVPSFFPESASASHRHPLLFRLSPCSGNSLQSDSLTVAAKYFASARRAEGREAVRRCVGPGTWVNETCHSSIATCVVVIPATATRFLARHHPRAGRIMAPNRETCRAATRFALRSFDMAPATAEVCVVDGETPEKQDVRFWHLADNRRRR